MKKISLFISLMVILTSIITVIMINIKNSPSHIKSEENRLMGNYPLIDSSNGFFILGGNIKDVQMVGIVHKIFNNVGITEKNDNLNRYNRFWKIYLGETNKNPSSIIIASEAARDTTNRIRRKYQLLAPRDFITQYLFDIGVNKIITCNTRPSYDVNDQKEYGSLLNIFAKSKGSMEVIKSNDPLGLPIVKIKDTPRVTDSDINLISSVWYNKYYLNNKEFEDVLARSFIGRSNIIPVVGAAHALNMYKNGQVSCVALTISRDDLLLALESIVEQDYYLKLINK